MRVDSAYQPLSHVIEEALCHVVILPRSVAVSIEQQIASPLIPFGYVLEDEIDLACLALALWGETADCVRLGCERVHSGAGIELRRHVVLNAVIEKCLDDAFPLYVGEEPGNGNVEIVISRPQQGVCLGVILVE